MGDLEAEKQISGMWIIGFLLVLSLWWADSQGWLWGTRGWFEQRITPLQSNLWLLRKNVVKSFMIWEDRAAVMEEVIYLRSELGKDIAKASDVARLQEENEFLRKLLGAPLSSTWQYLPGEVVGGSPVGWWINLGSQDGVSDDMLVLSESLLIGKIQGVHDQKAFVEALDSEEQNWEVEVKDKDSGVVHGNGILKYRDGRMYVERLLPNEAITKGDLVVTKGVAGVIPGVPIGSVAGVAIPAETAVYQDVEVWWPVNRDLVRHVAVIYRW